MTPSINRFATRLGKMASAHFLIFFALMLGCTATKTIRFVLPPGFVGLIEISKDEDGIELTGSAMTLFVPRDGKIRVKDLDYFNGWKDYEVGYSNGQAVPVRALSERSVQGRQFWVLPWHKGPDGSFTRFFVGHRAELEAYQKTATPEVTE